VDYPTQVGASVLFEYIVGGALVGTVVGATGVGGGSLMTPLLTLVFGLPAQVYVKEGNYWLKSPAFDSRTLSN